MELRTLLGENIYSEGRKMHSDIEILLGSNVKRFRESQGLTREQLAEISDISPQNIAKIEVGERFVSPKSLEKLCNSLNIIPSELFTEQQVRSSKPSKAKQRLDDLIRNQSEANVKVIYDVAVRILKALNTKYTAN